MPTIPFNLVIKQGLCREQADAVWSGLGPKQRRWLLCDVELDLRRAVFAAALGKAALVGLGYSGSGLCLLAWLSAVSPAGQTCALHLAGAAAGYEAALGLGREFIGACAGRLLMSLVPVKLAATIRLARELGFREACRLPSACWLVAWGRSCDGVLLVRQA